MQLDELRCTLDSILMWRWSAYGAKIRGLGYPCNARNKNLIFVASIITPGPARRDRDTANC